MTESAVSPLAARENFYVMIGSAAAQPGLQFVVIAPSAAGLGLARRRNS